MQHLSKFLPLAKTSPTFHKYQCNARTGGLAGKILHLPTWTAVTKRQLTCSIGSLHSCGVRLGVAGPTCVGTVSEQFSSTHSKAWRAAPLVRGFDSNSPLKRSYGSQDPKSAPKSKIWVTKCGWYNFEFPFCNIMGKRMKLMWQKP